MERLHVMDGYGYVFRAYYGLLYGGKGRSPVRLTNDQGMPTGALYVFAQMLLKLRQDVRPERMCVVFDAPGPSFRHDIDPEYKANRSETPDDLKEQLPHFRPLTEAFSWPVVAVEGYEADDVIATIVTQARARDWEVTVYSADKDLMQLVDEHVVVVDSMRDRTFDVAAVTEKFGVPPEKVGEWLSLVGDSSDNVPGMQGVGPKTATKLLEAHGTIDGILAHTNELKGKMRERFEDEAQLAQLKRSRELIALRRDVALPLPIEDMRPGEWDDDALRGVLEQWGFDALIKRLEGKKGAAPAAPKKATAAPSPSAELPPTFAHIAKHTDVREPVVLDEKALASEARAIKEAGVVAVRAEWSEDRPERAQLIGLALAVPGRAPGYVSLAHRYLGAPAPLPVEGLVEALSSPGLQIVCHDAKVTGRALESLGVVMRDTPFDSMLAAYLLDSSETGFSTKDVAKSVLDRAVESRKDVVGTGKKAVRYESIAVERAAAYAGAAVEASLHTAPLLCAQLRQQGLAGLLCELEVPVARLLSRMESIGVCLDTDYLAKLSDRVGGQIAELEREAHEHAGTAFNLGSPKQLSTLLFDTLGLRSERMKKTKTGYSTDHEVLEAMVDAHPIIRPILKHRELIKLKGTYIDALPPLINPATGRLHTDFRQAVAATGRLSSVDPNLQNIPIRSELGREIRRAFVAPPGHKLVSADYSQIELRVLAHLCEDPVLVKAFKEDVDIHAQTAAEVFGIALDEVGPNERRVAKAVNYGLAYGQTDFGLGRALDIPRKEAAEYIERYFERFPKVHGFMQSLIRSAQREGAAYTVMGRKRPIPNITAKNYRLRTAAERVAQNMPMQGSGADIMKLAMLKVDAAIERFEGRALLTVHDELLFEVPDSEVDEFQTAVRDAMESVYELKVPLKVDVGVADNWADAH